MALDMGSAYYVQARYGYVLHSPSNPLMLAKSDLLGLCAFNGAYEVMAIFAST